LEKCRDDFVQDSVDESMCELLTGAARNAQNYVAEVCKSPSIDCFKPSGCAKCLAGYVLSEDKTCIDSPCKNRRCPRHSSCRVVEGYDGDDRRSIGECFCNSGFVMTFNTETSTSICKTVVEAVKEDTALLSTDDERAAVVEAVKPSGPKRLTWEDLSLAINALAFLGIIVLISMAIYTQRKYVIPNYEKLHDNVRHTMHDSKHFAEFKDFIVAMEENVRECHHHIQDLHLITFHDDEKKHHKRHSKDGHASLSQSMPGSPPMPGSVSEDPAEDGKTSKRDALHSLRKEKGLHVHEGEHVYRAARRKGDAPLHHSLP
jgi:hypothetical protein